MTGGECWLEAQTRRGVLAIGLARDKSLQAARTAVV